MPPPIKRPHAAVSEGTPAVDIVDRVITRLHRDDDQMIADYGAMRGSEKAMAHIMTYLGTLMRSGDDTEVGRYIDDLTQALENLRGALDSHVRRPASDPVHHVVSSALPSRAP
jgi:hypothetical protein